MVTWLLPGLGAISNYGATGIADGVTDFRAFMFELIGTFLLMWAVMGVAVNAAADRSWAPWTIGGTLGFAVFILGPLTGAGLNPARAFAEVAATGSAVLASASSGSASSSAFSARASAFSAAASSSSYSALRLSALVCASSATALGGACCSVD